MVQSTNMRRFTAVALASCGWLVHGGPVIAQSSSGFERARTSFTSVHQYVAAEAIPRQLTAPPNLIVPEMYRPLVESMLRDSPTFRRQCLRIAGETALTVHLAIGSPPRRSDIRAITRITRKPNGVLTAYVDIGPLDNTVELIAHEFEHIIEQLDGVDLAARAALPRTGVSAVGPVTDIFETKRARLIGLKVAAEVRP
jgi:hypothetical protein